jgi:phosphonate transport system substrate-binding protein
VRVKRGTDGKSRSLGMRDTDRDFRAKLVVRKDAGIRSLSDLVGKTLAVGSRDSTQARILPLHFLKKEGVDLSRVKLLPFDTDLGKHGDTGTSELDVLAALHDGRAQAGTVGDLIWTLEQAAGHVDANKIEVLYTTPGFDHCMFDALPTLSDEKVRAFEKAIFAMKWDNPQHRRVLELEGLKMWVPPREEGYGSLKAALDEQNGW